MCSSQQAFRGDLQSVCFHNMFNSFLQCTLDIASKSLDANIQQVALFSSKCHADQVNRFLPGPGTSRHSPSPESAQWHRQGTPTFLFMSFLPLTVFNSSTNTCPSCRSTMSKRPWLVISSALRSTGVVRKLMYSRLACQDSQLPRLPLSCHATHG